MRSLATFGFCAVLLLAFEGLGTLSFEAAEIAFIQASTDVTVDLSGDTATHHHVFEDDLGAGMPFTLALGAMPPGAGIDAYHLEANGDALLSFDVAVATPFAIHPADVVLWDGGAQSLVFDASAAGVPDGANVDALTRLGDELLLSFDTTLMLSGITVEDQDVVRFDGANFSLVLGGFPRTLDLDAVHRFGNGEYLVSFDGDGALGDLEFRDDDLLRGDSSTGDWSLAYEGSSRLPDLGGTDLDAVYGEIEGLIFADGFESGDTIAWSSASP